MLDTFNFACASTAQNVKMQARLSNKGQTDLHKGRTSVCLARGSNDMITSMVSTNQPRDKVSDPKGKYNVRLSKSNLTRILNGLTAGGSEAAVVIQVSTSHMCTDLFTTSTLPLHMLLLLPRANQINSHVLSVVVNTSLTDALFFQMQSF